MPLLVSTHSCTPRLPPSALVLSSEGARALECVQEAGTMLFVPQGWLHATINLDDTVALAMELGPSALR